MIIQLLQFSNNIEDISQLCFSFGPFQELTEIRATPTIQLLVYKFFNLEDAFETF